MQCLWWGLNPTGTPLMGLMGEMENRSLKAKKKMKEIRANEKQNLCCCKAFGFVSKAGSRNWREKKIV